ncbi:hypothetical protein [Paenibacillus macerans]|uniref:hypothetical protein n=1 Tax=Paenibacillus macerans TaxID=44252 RepID=UPI003D316226
MNLNTDEHAKTGSSEDFLAGQNGFAYISQTLRLWVSCLMENALLLPVWLIFAAFFLPAGLSPAWLGMLPLLSLGGVLLGTRLRKLWQRGAAAALLGAGFAVAAALSASGGAGPGLLGLGDAPASAQDAAVAILQTFALFAACVFCLMQGMSAQARRGSFRLYWAGVGLYFIAGIAFPRIPALAGTVPLLTWSGLACLAVTLFVTNHQYLRYSSLSGDPNERLPAGLRRHNRLYIGAIVAVSVLLAAGAGRWIGGLLWELARRIVQWLTRRPEPEPLPEQPAAEMPSMEPFLPADTHEPGLLSRILDIAFYSLGILIGAALLGYLLYWLYRNGGGVWRRTIDRLLALLRKESAAAENAAYRDEEKSIFTWEAALQSWRQAGARLFRPGAAHDRWEDMSDNRERVRYLYRLLLRKERDGGYPLKLHLTPRETIMDIRRDKEQRREAGNKGRASSLMKRLAGDGVQATEPVREEPDSPAGELVRLYYRARYGEGMPRDEEVAELRQRLPK